MRLSPKIILTTEERKKLEELAENPDTPRALKRRSCTILACAEGKTNREIARAVGLTNLTVGRLRMRFLAGRLKDFEQERRGRRVPVVVLDSGERAILEKWTQASDLPEGFLQQARAILACAAGKSNIAVARETGISKITVGEYRKRFLARRLDSLMKQAGAAQAD